MAIKKKPAASAQRKRTAPAKSVSKTTSATKKAPVNQVVKKTKPVKKENVSKKQDALVLSSPFWNIWDAGKEYKVRVSIPGLTKRNIKVEVNGNLLTISSEKSTKSKKSEKNYLVREYNYSSWSKSIAMPQIIDAKGIKVSDKDGVLKINLHKA